MEYINDEAVIADHKNALAVRIKHKWVLLHAPSTGKPELPSDIKVLLQIQRMLTMVGRHIEMELEKESIY